MARNRDTSASGTPLLTLASLVVAVVALHLAKEILLPLALGIFLSFLLAPLADRLERWGLGRILSVISVVGVTFVALGMLGWIVTSQLVDLSDQLPRWQNEIVKKIEGIRPTGPSALDELAKTYDKVAETITGEKSPSKDPDDATPTKPKDAPLDADSASTAETTPVDEAESSMVSRLKRNFEWWDRRNETEQGPVDVRVVGMPPSPLGQVRDWLGPLVAPLTTAGIAIVLVIFILLKREDQRYRLLQLFGASNLHASTEALTDVADRVGKYLRMQFLINAGYGIAVGLGLAAFGVPSAITWGVLSFSLRFLPYIGPWLSAIMPLAVSIADSQGWTQPMLVATLFVVLELFVNNVAEPLLYGRSTGVSSVGVIVAAIFWTWIWGPIGLVIAMPLTVCVVVMSRYIPGLQFLTILLGDQSTMASSEKIYQRLLAGDCDEAVEEAEMFTADKDLVSVYDQAIIPAIIMAETDRHSGRLHEGQVALVQETARDLVDELGKWALIDRPGSNGDQADESQYDRPTLQTLCIPLRDQADDIAVEMLAQLLNAESIQVETAPVAALTSELVEMVETTHAELVILSIIPPLPPRSSRLLCRKLRDRYPHLTVIIGYWGGGSVEEIRRRLADDQAQIVTTLADAVERVKAIAARPRLVEPA